MLQWPFLALHSLLNPFFFFLLKVSWRCMTSSSFLLSLIRIKFSFDTSRSICFTLLPKALTKSALCTRYKVCFSVTLSILLGYISSHLNIHNTCFESCFLPYSDGFITSFDFGYKASLLLYGSYYFLLELES